MGVEAPYRIKVSRRMADAVAEIGHETTYTAVSARDGRVLVCPDPDGFQAAVEAWQAPSEEKRWVWYAARDVTDKVRQFRYAHPNREIH